MIVEWCVWDNTKHRPHREGLSVTQAMDWVESWRTRRAIIADIATSPEDRFEVRWRQITEWKKEGEK